MSCRFHVLYTIVLQGTKSPLHESLDSIPDDRRRRLPIKWLKNGSRGTYIKAHQGHGEGSLRVVLSLRRNREAVTGKNQPASEPACVGTCLSLYLATCGCLFDSCAPSINIEFVCPCPGYKAPPSPLMHGWLSGVFEPVLAMLAAPDLEYLSVLLIASEYYESDTTCC